MPQVFRTKTRRSKQQSEKQVSCVVACFFRLFVLRLYGVLTDCYSKNNNPFAFKVFWDFPLKPFPLSLKSFPFAFGAVAKKSGVRALSTPLFGFWIIALTFALFI
ncbi:hypothetical protein [Neisseria sp. 23W00734]|uniref:hypothetical protein n=1 Tax=Neisseria sp. 23W00734 TaxID=3374307 RepID=UPI00375811F6